MFHKFKTKKTTGTLFPALLPHIIFPPAKSDQDLTSGGMPSFLGNLAFMHRAKRRAVCHNTTNTHKVQKSVKKSIQLGQTPFFVKSFFWGKLEGDEEEEEEEGEEGG